MAEPTDAPLGFDLARVSISAINFSEFTFSFACPIACLNLDKKRARLRKETPPSKLVIESTWKDQKKV
jgi:hypothetical protein